jgi:hypothetical protein
MSTSILTPKNLIRRFSTLYQLKAVTAVTHSTATATAMVAAARRMQLGARATRRRASLQRAPSMRKYVAMLVLTGDGLFTRASSFAISDALCCRSSSGVASARRSALTRSDACYLQNSISSPTRTAFCSLSSSTLKTSACRSEPTVFSRFSSSYAPPPSS